MTYLYETGRCRRWKSTISGEVSAGAGRRSSEVGSLIDRGFPVVVRSGLESLARKKIILGFAKGLDKVAPCYLSRAGKHPPWYYPPLHID